jgi:hypothetical protein
VEPTGDDDVWYQTFFMETYVGLQLGPNPSIYAATIFQRVKDVSFVIDAVLAGKADRKDVPLAAQIEADKIGVPGYSLGGDCATATQRVIITYRGIPAARTAAPNTLPNILGTLGIASGQTRAKDFRKVKPIDFAALRNAPPVVLPFAGGGAIYSQYYQGVSGPCHSAERRLARQGASR